MERYKEYTALLTQVCKEKQIAINYKKINDGFRFFYVTINNNKEYDKTIVFSAGIHGDEHAGPYAILKFLSEYKEVDPSIHVIFLPVINPYGFNRGIRYNAFKQDINRRFCDKLLAGEAKASYDIIKKAKPDLFVSLHEWYGEDEFYMYASDLIQKEKISLIPKIATKNKFKLLDDKINGEQIEEGIIWHPEKGYLASDERSSCTLENKLYNDGIHYICTETPSKAKLSKRIKVQQEIMKFVIKEKL